MSAGYSAERNWSFLREPFWLFSHVFAFSLIGLFLFFCFGWQLPRHFDRIDQNDIIEQRALGEPQAISDALEQPIDELDFTYVTTGGSYVDEWLINVANRSQNGQAGDWLVGLFETSDGELLLVNRGFIIRESEPSEVIAGDLTGWLRESRERETFGATDNLTSERVPRLDIAALEERFADRLDSELGGQSFAPLWLQLESPSADGTFPEPVPLPELNSGPHLSYAVQWFIFALLGLIVYLLVLRKRAADHPRESTSL